MTYASVHLGAPPPVNRVFRNGIRPVMPTAEYKQWRNESMKTVLASSRPQFRDPVEVIIVAQRGRALPHEMIAPVIDALQHGLIITNADQIETVLARWATEHDLAVMGGRDIRVEIRSCT